MERKTEDVETTPAESGAKSAAKSGKSAQSGVKSGKSTKSTVSQPQLGFWGMCRWAWTQLTTMRVALILLAVAIHKGAGRLGWVRKHQSAIVRAGGIMLIVLGVLMATGVWNMWMTSLQGLIDGFEVVI